MTTYTITLDGTFAPAGTVSEDNLRGGLGGGYFYTTADSIQKIRLWNVSDLTAPKDTIDVGSSSSNIIFRAAQNNAGNCYVTRTITAGSSYRLASVTNSGDTLAVTTIGTVAVSSGQGLFVGADDSQVLCVSAGTAIAWNTSNAGTAYAVNYNSGHSSTVLITPAPDYFIGYCSTHTDYELWSGTAGSVVASINDDYSWTDSKVAMTPVDVDRTFVAGYTSSTNPKEYRLGVLSSAGGALSWEWGPTTLVTNWARSTAVTISPYVVSWGNRVLLGPKLDIDGSPPVDASWYVIDANTGEVSASDANPYTGAGIGTNNNTGAVWASASYFVIWPGIANTQDWSTWLVTALRSGFTYLRQRQSPKRTPSRVSWKAL